MDRRMVGRAALDQDEIGSLLSLTKLPLEDLEEHSANVAKHATNRLGSRSTC
jgi:hypothetical protein